MDSEERELLRASLRHATAICAGEALDDALDELGWRDALATDPRAAVSMLFELQGSANASSSAIDIVVTARLGLDQASTSAFVLPPLGQCHPSGTVTAERLDVRGVGTAALRRCNQAVLVAAIGEELVTVVVDTAALDRRPVSGLDPRFGIVEVAGDRMRATSRSATSPARWADAIAAGQVALAHELVGASRAMLELASDHARERVQFGRPIAAFQGVGHRLADSLVAIEAADAALGAWWDCESPLNAALAKAIAGRGARTAARHCQQVLGGIGFTTEHAFHRYLRRALLLDGLLGDARTLTQELGEHLIRTRRLPSTLPL